MRKIRSYSSKQSFIKTAYKKDHRRGVQTGLKHKTYPKTTSSTHRSLWWISLGHHRDHWRPLKSLPTQSPFPGSHHWTTVEQRSLGMWWRRPRQTMTCGRWYLATAPRLTSLSRLANCYTVVFLICKITVKPF